MANSFSSILDIWYPKKDECKWVLATIFETQGSSYRKSGAHMLINDLGQYYGLLSGGCLESDIMLQARRCWDNGQGRIVEYDMTEEQDLAWQLGIGCGGLVRILLQPISSDNHYLQLDNVYRRLADNGYCLYSQEIASGVANVEFSELPRTAQASVQRDERNGRVFLKQILSPPINLCIVGAGVDARPVVDIAAKLGWRVTLLDPRTSHGRSSYFPGAFAIIKQPMTTTIEKAAQSNWLAQTDAMIIMSHNITIDAQALILASKSSAKYVGMLGPLHRTERVFEQAGLVREEFAIPFANPIGLRLGGELPESIALSMIAEVHSFLAQKDAKSISGVV
ncbi:MULTISPECIES: XdhC family protein [Alteromonadaceae]|uniref:XdhC family protein n=1 Tax=Alteromonadaceae TaxID=72275 RepID=UPI001C09C572|nr:XdhC/CoxI family protein [Aliiglaciecola lipolytica]MBU2876242.1 XdhC family protein [Aliiglaciecola lipolytica]